MGEKKVKDYGQKVITLIQGFLQRHPEVRQRAAQDILPVTVTKRRKVARPAADDDGDFQARGRGYGRGAAPTGGSTRRFPTSFGGGTAWAGSGRGRGRGVANPPGGGRAAAPAVGGIKPLFPQRQTVAATSSTNNANSSNNRPAANQSVLQQYRYKG